MSPASFRTALILACLFVTPARAQSKIQPENDPTDPTGLWDADVMMEQATINISRRYNLNQEQEAYTRQLLKSRTRAFLAEHEDDLRGMLKELFVQQLRGATPDSEQAQTWGHRAEPLLEAAKKAILDGNLEWRDVLDEKQRKIHDIDLRLMNKNFQMLEERFTRWSQGDFKPSDYLTARPAPASGIRQRPRLSPTAPLKPSSVQRSEDFWDIYVKKFIRDYDLDDAQRNSALAILKDMKEKVARVRKHSETERKAAQEALHQLIRDKADSQKLKEASRRMRLAHAPIAQLFEELRSRLARLPTEAQRKRVEHDYIGQTAATQPADPSSKSDPTEKKPTPTPESKPPGVDANTETSEKSPPPAPTTAPPPQEQSTPTKDPSG